MLTQSGKIQVLFCLHDIIDYIKMAEFEKVL